MDTATFKRTYAADVWRRLFLAQVEQSDVFFCSKRIEKSFPNVLNGSTDVCGYCEHSTTFLPFEEPMLIHVEE